MADEATKAFNEKDIVLPSGKELHLVPLSLKNLRKFMLLWGAHVDWMRSSANLPEDERPNEEVFAEKNFDVYEKLLALGLEKPLKEYDKKNDVTTNVEEFIEDEIDEGSMYVILEITGGLDLSPDKANLAQAMANQ